MQQVLNAARNIWPSARLTTAKKLHHCEWQTGNGLCKAVILPGALYVDPGEANPERAGGYGGFRFCLSHFKEEG